MHTSLRCHRRRAPETDTLCVTRAWPRRSGAINEEKRCLCVSLSYECASEMRSVPLQPGIVLSRAVGVLVTRAHARERERERED